MLKALAKGKKLLIPFLIIVLLIVLFLIWQDNSIVITNLDYKSPRVPDGFDGFVVAHISDLHNKRFGKDQWYILKKLESSSPDIIVVTGDLIDRRRYDLETAMDFIGGAVKLAPVYYVSGNHEAWCGDYETIKKRLTSSGVTVLDNESAIIQRGRDCINVLGAADPAFYSSSDSGQTVTSEMRRSLDKWSELDGLKLLLSHRPELIELYKDAGMDIVFSGHAHGGQIRLPFVGGILAPGQGFFPKYTSGMYTEGSTSLVVSRGLGNSVFPFRIFNRPEIVVVSLNKK